MDFNIIIWYDISVISIPDNYFPFTHSYRLSSVNYCSHSSRGVKWGQLRVPGWLSQTGTLERHSGDWGARETESWNCRGRDARAHGRFSPPAYWGAPCLSPKPDHRVERSYVSTVIGEKTVNQRPCFLIFLILHLLFFAFPFLWVQILMWARGAVFPLSDTRRWRATTRHNVYIDVGGLSPSDAGSPDEGEMLCAYGCSRQDNGPVTQTRKGVKHRHRQPRKPPAPPASVDSETAPAASASPQTLSLSLPWWVRVQRLVYTTSKICLLSAQPVVLRTSGYVSYRVFFFFLH